MTLDGLMFESLFLTSSVDRIVRAEASVLLRVFDAVIISAVVKRGGILAHRPWTHEELDGGV